MKTLALYDMFIDISLLNYIYFFWTGDEFNTLVYHGTCCVFDFVL